MSSLRAEAGYMRDLGFKPFPLKPSDPKKMFYERLPWINATHGRGTWKKTLDARYLNTYGITTDAELDFMFPDEQGGMALAVGRRSATEWIFLIDFDVKGRLRTESRLVRQLLFQQALKSKGITLPDHTPLSETGSGGLHAYLAAVLPADVELGDKYGSIPWAQAKETYRFIDANGNSQTRPIWVIELKALGYGVEAPTIHATGTPYEWITRPQAPIPIAPAILVQAMVRVTPVRAPREPGTVHDVPEENLALAVEALAAIWHPVSGHTAAQALGGWLGKNNVSEETTVALMEDLCHAAGDTHEIPNRTRAARDSWTAAQDDERAYGYPTLAKQLGQEPLARIAQKLKTWLQFRPVEVVIVPTIGGGTDPVITVTTPTWADCLKKYEDDLFVPKSDLTISTGIAKLDDWLEGGLGPEEYVLIAAATSVGKSALLIKIIRTCLLRGAETLFANCEMTNGQFFDRLYALESGLRVQNFRNQRRGRESFVSNQRAAYEAAKARLQALPFHLHRDLRSPAEIANVLRANSGIRVVCVDYLQKMVQALGQESGRSAVEAMSRDFADLAKDFGVTMIVNSQVARATGREDRGDAPPDAIPKVWYPRLNSFRESGMLEADCDVALLLAREIDKSAPSHTRLACRVAKNRDNGPGPWFELGFNGPMMSVVNDPSEAQP